MEFAVGDSRAQLAQLTGANGHAIASAPAKPSPTPAPASGPGAASAAALTAEPGAPASDAGGDVGSEAPVNPRKRKKASRACDFCHVNHQPCDNAQPKCGVCQKHNKPCLYLRPTKRRGPQKGYRTALNSYKESAAAWGAVLSAIPGLDALIEGHLLGSSGSSITAAIKDSSQQEVLINKWQSSTVFKAIFGHNNPVGGITQAKNGVPSQDAEAEDEDYAAGDDNSLARLAPTGRSTQASTPQKIGASGADQKSPTKLEASYHQRDITSLSDIVAKDAAQSSSRASRTLASLGFAPNETIADFNTMGSNPEPIGGFNDQDLFDPTLGSESEQRAYYELLMGRSFPG